MRNGEHVGLYGTPLNPGQWEVYKQVGIQWMGNTIIDDQRWQQIRKSKFEQTDLGHAHTLYMPLFNVHHPCAHSQLVESSRITTLGGE